MSKKARRRPRRATVDLSLGPLHLATLDKLIAFFQANEKTPPHIRFRRITRSEIGRVAVRYLWLQVKNSMVGPEVLHLADITTEEKEDPEKKEPGKQKKAI